MTTQNNIFESMLKYRQKTSVSNVIVRVLKFNSTIASNFFTNNTKSHAFAKHSYEVCIAHCRSYYIVSYHIKL